MSIRLPVNRRLRTGFIFSQKLVDIDKIKKKIKLMNSAEICIEIFT